MENFYLNSQKSGFIKFKSNSIIFFKSIIITLVIFVSGIGVLKGQASLYTHLNTTTTYTPIAGTQLIAGAVDDGVSALTNIGFNFQMCGVTHTQFSANSNGYIQLGSVSTSTNRAPLSTATTSNYSIAGLARDGKTGGAVTYLLSGVAPNRVLTVQYATYYPSYLITTVSTNFQIKLYETTNVIELVYGGSVTTTTSYPGQVGFRGAVPADFANRVTPTASWASSSVGPLNTSTMAFLTATAPSSGRVLRWTPPPPPTITSISPTSGCPGTSLTITGTNLTGATAANVKVGGTAVTSITSNSGSSMVVVVGAGTTGTVSVTTISTATSTQTFTVGPTTQASAITFSSITGGSASINWTNGTGAGRVVYINNVNTFTAPINGSNPTANTAYVGSGQQCVFNNTVSGPVSVTGLSPGVTYYVQVYEYCSPSLIYNTTTATSNPNSFTTPISPAILQSGSLTAFSACQNIASSQQSFTVSGQYLTNNIIITAPTGFQVSTTSGSFSGSTVTLTQSGGTVASTIIYVRMQALASSPTAGSISITSTGATSLSQSVSGTVLPAPTVSAGSNFSMCSGQTVAMNASTNATSSSGTASSGTVTASGTDNLNPTGTYTFSGLPAGAVINGITVNITSAGGVNCPGWYSVTTRLNGVQQGAAGCAGSTTYTNLNGQAANGLVVAVRGQDNDGWGDAMTITYTVTLNYLIPPTYAWSPTTGLSASNILNPNCTATSTTTYTLTVTATNGCSNSAQVVATVAGTAPAAPSGAVNGSSVINVGGTVNLTSPASTTVYWYTTATGGTSFGTGTPVTSPVQCTPGTVTFYAEANNGTCASATRTPISITVRPMVVSNPANALICQTGGSVTLSAQLTGASGSISWSPNTNLSATTGTSTIASPTTTTVYTMSATVTGCGAVSTTQTVGVIDAVAFTPTSTPASVCAGNTAALASNLSSSGFTVQSITNSPSTPVSPSYLINASTVPVVPLTSGTNDDGGWSSIPLGFTYNFFGSNYTTVNVGTNGVIQFGAYNANGGFTAPYGLGDYTFTNNFPTTLEPMNIIAGGACDLTISSGTVRYWTQGIAPTRVFVLEYNVLGLSSGSNNFQIKLFETTGIVEIHVTSNTAQTGSNKVIGINNFDGTIGSTAYSSVNNLTNTAWKFIPGANYTFQWATAGSNISGATATTYTTPVLSTPGSVTYSVAATNPNTQCTTTQSVNITVNALPAAPISSGDVTACNTAGAQNLVVTTGSGVTADWYNASSAGTLLTNNNTTHSTSTAGTYYAESEDLTTGCKSSTRTAVTLTLNAAPTAPTASSPTYCQGATASQLTASAPSGTNTQSWYTVSTGGTPLAGAPTPSTSTATTLTYYVGETSASNGCESSRTTVTVTINPTPTAPSVSNPSPYCQNDAASALTATAGSGNSLLWYTVPTGGTGSSTAITPSTATSGTNSYYVSQISAQNCESPRSTITVTVNPNITASVSNSASSTSSCGGGAITFTATPTNGGTPTYQWYLNGTLMSGETNATYTLASPADNDQIYVEMTPSAQTCLTSAAAIPSNTVTLSNVPATPTVSIQSSATSAICPGISVTFSVNSSSNMGSTPSYQWMLNGNPISGANASTYSSTTLANNDQVTLEMTSSLTPQCLNASSATSSQISTSVNVSTSITTQPVAAAACAGASASFTVSATGQGTLTYQWQKNGVNITGNNTATTNTLTLSGVSSSDAANYSVIVTGGCGASTSSNASFTLNTATSITTQPVAVTQCNGTNATYSVVAVGQGTLSYQWRLNGSPISGATNSSYTVNNIALANAGNYSVVISGGCGNLTSSNASLTVQPLTSISTQPTASTLCQNNNANFSVTASGQGTLSYQWNLNGNPISGATSSTLAVTNAQSVNAGSYTVNITGGCGTVTSNAAVLTVNPSTTITTQPVAVVGCVGQNATFTVVAAGTGTLSYQWKFGPTNISGATLASYNIPSATTANDGNYSVVINGGCGSATSSTVSLNSYPNPSTIANISTADILDGTLCGKNQVSVVANAPGSDSQGQWSIVGSWNITPGSNTAPSTTFTADNAALAGSPKKFVWSHIRTTSGTSCYSRDTITVDFKQPTYVDIASTVASGDFLWNGLTNTSWSTSDNWYQYNVTGGVGSWYRVTTGEPSGTSRVNTISYADGGVCIHPTNVPSLGNGEAAGFMYVGDNATLNLASGSLSLTGDLLNNGTINPSTGTVILNGTGSQTISGTGLVANFNNLTINKASGLVTLNQPVKVSGVLTMLQGDVVTTSANILEVGSSASNVGSVSWTSGTVRGPMKRWFATATNTTVESGIFPVGVQSGTKTGTNRYAQVNFSSAPSVGGYIIAEYKTGMPGNNYAGLPLNYSSGGYSQAIQNAEEEGYWDITPYNASNTSYGALNSTPYTLKVRLQNPSTLTTGWTTNTSGNNLYDPSSIRMIRARGNQSTPSAHTNWELAGTHVLSSGTAGDYFITSNNITQFSWFNGGGNNQNPLPVELISFSGNCDAGNVTLEWKTASEHNSAYFDVEKSRDGENWQVINTVTAAGNSNSVLTYNSIDENATNGNNYYRLKQVDIDGAFKIYNVINASCLEENKGYFSSFPNPSGGAFQLVVNNKEIVGASVINILDSKGSIITQKEIEVKEGINMFIVNENMLPGIYFISITNGDKSTEVIRHSVK